jgi:hypothetical protein
LNLDEDDLYPGFAASILHAPDVMNHRRQSGQEMVQDLESPLIPCLPGYPEIGMRIQVLHIDDDESCISRGGDHFGHFLESALGIVPGQSKPPLIICHRVYRGHRGIYVQKPKGKGEPL